MSVRLMLDPKLEYAVVVRSEGIDVVHLVNSDTVGWPYADRDT